MIKIRTKKFVLIIFIFALIFVGLTRQGEAAGDIEREIAARALKDLDALECFQNTTYYNINADLGIATYYPHCLNQETTCWSSAYQNSPQEVSILNSTEDLKVAFLEQDTFCNTYASLPFCCDQESQTNTMSYLGQYWPSADVSYINSLGESGDVRYRCRSQKGTVYCYAYRCEEASPAGCKQMWRIQRKINCRNTCRTPIECHNIYGSESADVCARMTKCFDVGEDDTICPYITDIMAAQNSSNPSGGNPCFEWNSYWP